MKHRVTLFMLLLVLAGGILPGVVAAQDSDSGWDLSQDLKFTDLGLDVKYPTDWVYAATDKSGVFIGESKDDVALATDGDPSTVATGTIINVIAQQTASLAANVGADAKLDQYVDFVVKAFNTTEKDKRLEAPIVGHRSLTTFAEDTNSQGVIITTWLQGDWLVVASLTAPDYDTATADLVSWVGFMKGITPLGASPLSTTPITLNTSNATVSFPDGWFLNDKSTLAFDTKSDLDNGTIDNSMIFVGEQSLSDLKLKDDATIADAVATISANIGVTPTKEEEFILLGQPAIMFTGVDGTGKYVEATQAIVNGVALQISLVSASEDKLKAAEPTYLAVIQSLAAIKTDS